MKTEIIKLDINNIDMDKLRFAADVLKNGGLVAFPTETVYGLGADALNETAVKGIFNAKGRPGDNPLIVHIADKSDLKNIVSAIPCNAPLLMDNFWPGPLTMVMAKAPSVPSVITAGLETVAVRMPSHPVALALIRESGVPVAAPSANTSGKPSPTTAKHVIDDLMGRVDVIIDAGCSKVGLESTVIDMTSDPAMILRPGGITPAQLKSVLGTVDMDPAIAGGIKNDVVPKSPGMKYLHYSPKAQVIIIKGSLCNLIAKTRELIKYNSSKGLKVGIMATEQTKDAYSYDKEEFPGLEIISVGDRDKPETIASNLFLSLREFDTRKVHIILAESIESKGIGIAVMNRMNKAAGYNIINADED